MIRPSLPVLAALALLSACRDAGAPSGSTSAQDTIPVACRLGALSASERAREHELLGEHLRSVVEVREQAGGYSFRYPSDALLFARMAELVALEHRCCPFLGFSLEWPGADATPWMNITGGERVKQFVAATFTRRGR